jgi:hypothetical protein
VAGLLPLPSRILCLTDRAGLEAGLLFRTSSNVELLGKTGPDFRLLNASVGITIGIDQELQAVFLGHLQELDEFLA